MAEPEILNVPPSEAVDHFKAKGRHVGFDWRDTDAATHLRSFTVAKAMRLDILEAVRGEVDRAIADGIAFGEFHESLEPRLRSLGWWGRQPMVDPETGEVRVVQLGSPHRLNTIFDTNLRTSYAAGRWERIQRVKESSPWLRYVAVQDSRTRPDHMAWHGTVLPVDHPFWRTHYPPNGWKCRCTVEQLSDRDLEEFGLSPSDGPPEGSGETRPWLNRRSGEAAPPALARAAVGTPWNTPLFGRHLSGASDGDWPVAAVEDAALKSALGAKSGVVRLSGETAAKQMVRHAELVSADYALVQRILDEGELFRVGKHHAIGFLSVDGEIWSAVVKATGDRSRNYLVSLHRGNQRNLQRVRDRSEQINQ